MIVEHHDGSIFESGCKVLVNPVNCEGVMGAGLAKQFKMRFPKDNAIYEDACSGGEVRVGEMFITDAHGQTIFHFPTKNLIYYPSQLEYIDVGMESLCTEMLDRGYKSVAIPALGAGLGGLDWNLVYPIIKASVERNMPHIEVHIYHPQ
jgi:O-acetyl-ADP-ribose deacetylase (regulator of RNase III)